MEISEEQMIKEANAIKHFHLKIRYIKAIVRRDLALTYNAKIADKIIEIAMKRIADNKEDDDLELVMSAEIV
jgi:hypothetical protein